MNVGSAPTFSAGHLMDSFKGIHPGHVTVSVSLTSPPEQSPHVAQHSCSDLPFLSRYNQLIVRHRWNHQATNLSRCDLYVQRLRRQPVLNARRSSAVATLPIMTPTHIFVPTTQTCSSASSASQARANDLTIMFSCRVSLHTDNSNTRHVYSPSSLA